MFYLVPNLPSGGYPAADFIMRGLGDRAKAIKSKPKRPHESWAIILGDDLHFCLLVAWPVLICSAVTGDHRNLRKLGKLKTFNG